MDLALGKLKTPEGIDVIALDHNQMVTVVAEGKLKEPEGIEEILL